ncbi:MAG: S-methyl-5-thioribose-1-phosphate isomerase [Candidatus Hermodarchaeota archaeon]
MIEEAKIMAQEDINVNKGIGKNGAALLKDGDVVLTHCNAGSLATVQYGTALAPVRAAIEEGKKVSVIGDETCPRLQGARLTAFELQYDKIPVKVISDTSSGLIMRLGKINKVIVGTDRVSSDAVFNKIGTYLVALAAKDNDIPFYVAAPTSTLSLSDTVDDVTIEQRDSSEVSNVLGKVQITPNGVECLNYAFDITPFRLVTGIITEDGVFSPEELLNKYRN